MSILYVGFKGKNNASNKLVSAIQGEKLFLTNSFAGLKKDIENISKEYDRVYMFGIDKALSKTIRIEKCAEVDSDLICSKMDIESLHIAFLQNNIESEISQTPTHYLCNEAYYQMLKKSGGNAVFIHIPGIKNITNELIEGIIRCTT